MNNLVHKVFSLNIDLSSEKLAIFATLATIASVDNFNIYLKKIYGIYNNKELCEALHNINLAVAVDPLDMYKLEVLNSIPVFSKKINIEPIFVELSNAPVKNWKSIFNFNIFS